MVTPKKYNFFFKHNKNRFKALLEWIIKTHNSHQVLISNTTKIDFKSFFKALLVVDESHQMLIS